MQQWALGRCRARAAWGGARWRGRGRRGRPWEVPFVLSKAYLILRNPAGRQPVGNVLPQKTLRAPACSNAGARGRTLRRRSEEHTSELQSLMRISYAVFCLKKKKQHTKNIH